MRAVRSALPLTFFHGWAGPAARTGTLVLLWAQPLAGQTAVVSGAVTDSAGAPIEYARVRATGTDLRALTDGTGRFRLAPVRAGQVVLHVDRVGYGHVVDTLAVEPGESLFVNVTLAAAAFVAEPVVVTAAKRSQLLNQTITSVAVVSDTELARRAVTTVDEAVDKAPGVQFLNSQVNIRGSTGYVQGLGSRVLLLVDGVPANQGDRGGINWDLVPLQDVQRVEIVKGAGSSLYGSSAFGGIVNVLTRDIEPGVHARVRARAGAFANPPHEVWRFRDYTGAEEGVDVTGSYGADALGASLTAGGWHSDGYREQDRRNHWQSAGKAEWRPDRATRVTTSGSWASDQYETPLIWCTRGTCDDRGQTYQPFRIDTNGRGAFTRSDKGIVAATLERTASARLAWQARGSWLRTHFIDYQPGNNDAGVANRFGAELRGLLHPSDNSLATVGAEGARSGVTSDIFGDHSQTEFAAYGESEQRLGGARLTAGARIDYIAVDGGGLSAVMSPRVGVVLPAGPDLVWRASAGRGFRAPSLAERFVSTVVQGLTVIPNPDLDPETAWSFELGNAGHLSSTVRWDAALFWTEAYHLIEPRVETATSQIQFQNVTRARLAGLDLSVTAAPLAPRLTTALSYTFLYARELAQDSMPERPLAFRPKHLLTLTADYQWRTLGVGGDFRYASRLERVELDESDPRVAEKVLDLRAGLAHGPLSLGCRLANALNYIYNQVPRTLAPVRTLSVTLTWTH